MSVRQSLVTGLRGGGIEAVDLTAPLSSETPILKLPEPFADTGPFRLEELSGPCSRRRPAGTPR